MLDGEARATEVGWNALLPHLEGLEHLVLNPGWNPDAWMVALLESPMVRSLRTLSVPAWLDKPLQARLEKAVKQVTFRKEDRLRFDRETGYYLPRSRGF